MPRNHNRNDDINPNDQSNHTNRINLISHNSHNNRNDQITTITTSDNWPFCMPANLG